MALRPNLVFIFTDQQNSQVLGCENSELKTPAMDAIAAAGTRFSNAYCTQPLCSPARASMFSGVMPHQCGVTRNGQVFTESIKAHEMGAVFSQAGYECAYAGKWHIPGSQIPEGHGFRKLHGHSDHGLADACGAFIASKHDKPFLLVASFDNPHNICEWARSQRLPWGPIVEPASISECPNLPANFAIPAYEPEIIRWEQRSAPQKYPTINFSWDDWRRYRYVYQRLVEKVDIEIGHILSALQRAGMDKDTVIIFSSDHGDGNGAHQWNQKSVLYEESIGVPFIVRLPGETKAGHSERQRLVSCGLDLMPTLCDYAGITVPAACSGRSVRALAAGDSVAWRDDLVITTTFDAPSQYPGGGYFSEGRVLRSERYKYTVYGWGRWREQLHDMVADRGEMVNLADDMRYRDVLEDHRRRLARWCAETRDRFTVPGFEY